MTIQEQIQRFEQLQKELTIMGSLGIMDRSEAERIYKELKEVSNFKLKLINGGKK